VYIVAYHNVLPDGMLDEGDGEVLTRISLSRFEREVARLHRLFRFVTLRDITDALEAGSGPAAAIAFTFDDGYQGAYRYAIPVIESYGVGATIFVVTSRVGAPCQAFDRIEIALRIAAQDRIDLRDLDVGLGVVGPCAAGLKALKARLKRLPPAAAGMLEGAILAHLGVRDADVDAFAAKSVKYAPMTWDELIEASERGHVIGSHTVSHPSLARVPPYVVERELIDSLVSIRRRIPECQWIPFAYPYGTSEDVSGAVAAAVARAGYACAVTTSSGANGPGANVFRLCRVVADDAACLG
jgi:peptidoglycan/xylan/chitin deacetylase (PgdA/CDA1 family)